MAASAYPSAGRKVFFPLTTTGCVVGHWLASYLKPKRENKVEGEFIFIASRQRDEVYFCLSASEMLHFEQLKMSGHKPME